MRPSQNIVFSRVLYRRLRILDRTGFFHSMILQRYTRSVDGTIPVSALLYDDEDNYASQDNVGIYDGYFSFTVLHLIALCLPYGRVDAIRFSHPHYYYGVQRKPLRFYFLKNLSSSLRHWLGIDVCRGDDSRLLTTPGRGSGSA